MMHPKSGDDLKQWRIPSVSTEAMKTMAVLLADPNPIHLDVEAVRALNLGDRVINQGPINIGYVVDMVRDNFPTARLERFQARLLSNVLGGDDVTAGGTVEKVERLDDGLHVESRVWLDVAGGGRAIEGTASVVLP